MTTPVTTGAAAPVTLTMAEASVKAPLGSKVRSRTVYGPLAKPVELNVGLATFSLPWAAPAPVSPYAPSPSRSHRNVIGSPSGSVDPALDSGMVWPETTVY